MKTLETPEDPEKEASKEIFLRLLQNYSDEIPPQVVHTGPYKVRGNWFHGVFSHTRLCIRKGWITDQQFIQQFQAFAEDFIHRKRTIRPFSTSREDIEKANSILRFVIENL